MRKNRVKTKYFTVENLSSLTAGDVFKHVQLLYATIALQNRKIKKLNLKIKKMKFLSKLDAQLLKTQQQEDETKTNETESNSAAGTENDKKSDDVQDFLNDIKNTAIMKSYEQAGFIYEPTSGLYWDSKTGYYYNNQCDLYYNGTNGNWYRLNPITNEFIFHSSTEAAKAVQKVQNDNSLDSLLKDFKSLTIKRLQSNALEIDEEEAIRKILDEGRQPVGQKSEKEKSRERKTRRYSSSSESSDDSRNKRRRSRRSRSHSRRSRSRSRNRRGRRGRRSRSRSKSRGREDGECDTTDSEEIAKRDWEANENFRMKRRKKKKGNDYEEIAKKYPPSLRLIVIESKVSKIQVGKLFVVTFKGGTLGREGKHHHVLLPVEDVSKEHLKFTYSKKNDSYEFIDKSRNGTMLNGKQISLLKQEECEPQTLLHGDVLEVGRIKMLAHVHEGLSTCNECEPYNYAQKPQEDPNAKTASDDLLPPSLSHKEQLKLLQKRYGLEAEKYQEKPSGTSNKNYEDRASQRRKKVGSSHDSAKTVTASVNQSISSENKGFKMLSKMGWNEGTSIGKNDSGIKEPVQVKAQTSTTGLGHETAGMSLNLEGSNNKKKKAIWSKTQDRYNKLKQNDDDE